MNDKNAVIAKAPPPDISMDYQRLRAEGIRHLEKLATQIWTDFNAHDPGITILEVLCYAITDLGYRANLPLEDILAVKPGAQQQPFFMADEILNCRPVTVPDYRKLLIDLEGVKNAWVQKAETRTPSIYVRKVLQSKALDEEVVEDVKTIMGKYGVEEARYQGMLQNGKMLNLSFSYGQWVNAFEMARKMIPRLVHVAETRPYIYTIEALTKEQGLSFAKIPKFARALTGSPLRGKSGAGREKQTETPPEAGPLSTMLQTQGINAAVADKNESGAGGAQQTEAPPELGPMDAVLQAQRINAAAAEISCKYGSFELRYEHEIPPDQRDEFKELMLNGLYHIILEIDETVDREKDEVIQAALDRLHQNRNLGEDFQEMVALDVHPLTICLDIEAAANADERGVMAQVLFNLQEFLTPRIHFYTFQEMLDKGYSCEEIYNGPLLEHGFIDNAELEMSSVPPGQRRIYKSDLYRVIMETPQVQGVREFTISNNIDNCFSGEGENWVLTVGPNQKPAIHLKGSTLRVSKGVLYEDLAEAELADELDYLQWAQLQAGAAAGPGCAPPRGRYREGLGQYLSIQHELPPNYGVGEAGIPGFPTPKRRAQAKQLQAYLLFYDQILASYLAQLARVRDLLSVEQDAGLPTYFYQALYEVPGMRSLLRDFMRYVLTDNSLQELEDSGIEQVVIDKLRPLAGKCYIGSVAFEKAIKTALGESLWLLHKEAIIDAVEHPATTFKITDDTIRIFRESLLDEVLLGLLEDIKGQPYFGENAARAALGELLSADYDKYVDIVIDRMAVLPVFKFTENSRARLLEQGVDPVIADQVPALAGQRFAGEGRFLSALGEAIEGDWEAFKEALLEEARQVIQAYVVAGETIEAIQDQMLDQEALAKLESVKGRPYGGNEKFKNAMAALLGNKWPGYQSAILHGVERIPPTVDADWEDYTRQEDNHYREELRIIAESEAHHLTRKGQLLDHLLARFGEQFTTYVLSLFRPYVDPVDDPWHQSFKDYLKWKAQFLRELPALGSERGKAYNYKAARSDTGGPDAWNTRNVAGLKKRVCHLLGIHSETRKDKDSALEKVDERGRNTFDIDYSTRSLLGKPDYKASLKKEETSGGIPIYQVQLLDRKTEKILLYSEDKYRRRDDAARIREKVYQLAWKEALYEQEAVKGTEKEIAVLPFTVTAGARTADVRMISRPLSETEAKRLVEEIARMGKPDDGDGDGFHILEHILLRPDDTEDKLLELPLTCLPSESPKDPYSFWISAILPNWTNRFRNENFRRYFEQTFRRETPAHIAVRFCWIGLDKMYRFEPAYKRWMEEKAKCTPDECEVTQYANRLIRILEEMPRSLEGDEEISCYCYPPQLEPEKLCDIDQNQES